MKIDHELSFFECVVITILTCTGIFLLGWLGIGIDPFAK
jgi:hypothetical protein